MKRIRKKGTPRNFAGEEYPSVTELMFHAILFASPIVDHVVHLPLRTKCKPLNEGPDFHAIIRRKTYWCEVTARPDSYFAAKEEYDEKRYIANDYGMQLLALFGSGQDLTPPPLPVSWFEEFNVTASPMLFWFDQGDGTRYETDLATGLQVPLRCLKRAFSFAQNPKGVPFTDWSEVPDGWFFGGEDQPGLFDQ